MIYQKNFKNKLLFQSMFSIINNWQIKRVEQMNDNSENVIEESGRGCRSRKRQVDPSCCPVCSVTLRASELDQHLVTEIDRLTKLSVKTKKNMKSQNSSSSSMSTSNSVGKGWETYQKIKMNRQVRLKVKSKKRKNDEITCPVCNETTTEDITGHVEMCLRKVEQNNDSGSEDENIDVEGFEEYEWAGQTRIRASSLLEGGFAGVGVGTPVAKPTVEEEEADVIVDGDDTQMYGQVQYTETDLLNRTESDKETEVKSKEESQNNIETSASQTVVEALKSRIRELEARDQNKELYKCLICMAIYKTPVVSVCCWHVHCEQCWIKTLQTKKLCPQCNMITSPIDLRRIYI